MVKTRGVKRTTSEILDDDEDEENHFPVVPVSRNNSLMQLDAEALANLTNLEGTLVVTKHTVHRMDEQGGGQTYVVSKDKWFIMWVEHQSVDGQIVFNDTPIWLRASVVYDTGLPVQQRDLNEQLLLGQTEVMMFNGKAEFKLKMGPQVLSELHQKRFFRIKIEPSNAQQNPISWVWSEPMKSLTKLNRKPNPRAPHSSEEVDKLRDAVDAVAERMDEGAVVVAALRQRCEEQETRLQRLEAERATVAELRHREREMAAQLETQTALLARMAARMEELEARTAGKTRRHPLEDAIIEAI